MSSSNFKFTGISDEQLKASITLVLMGKYNKPRTISSYTFTDDSLKLYWSPSETLKLPSSISARKHDTGFPWNSEVVFTVVKQWLKSDEAKKILDNEPAFFDNLYGKGFSIKSVEDEDKEFSCAMIIKPIYKKIN